MYLDRFEALCEACDIGNTKRSCTLISIIGSKPFAALHQVCAPVAVISKEQSELKDLLLQIYDRHIIAARYQFHYLCQKPFQVLKDYVRDMKY